MGLKIEGRDVAFRKNYRKTPKSPDFIGKMLLPNGEEAVISLWVSVTGDGNGVAFMRGTWATKKELDAITAKKPKSGAEKVIAKESNNIIPE